MPDEIPLPGPIHGLSEAEAQARLQAEGYNELPRPDRRTPLRIVLEVVREPMLALLLGGVAVYLLLGDLKEAIILGVFATLSILITVIQESRTERVLEALRDLTSPRALVIRDGVRKRITGREVVRGDILVLAEGDRVPADAVIIECRDLQTDESLLTGESVPVRKTARAGAGPSESRRPGGDDLPYGVLRLAGGARHGDQPRSLRPASAARSARSASRSPRWRRSRRGCRRRPAAWCGFSPSPARRSAFWRWCCTAPCAADGWMRCWRASRSACRCSRKNFRSCLPCSWRWARGESRRRGC